MEKIIKELESKRITLAELNEKHNIDGQKKMLKALKDYSNLLEKEFGIRADAPMDALTVIKLINAVLDKKKEIPKIVL